MEAIRTFFDIEKHGSSIKTELRAGLVTFLTMAYILLVNPQILSQAGLPPGDVAAATAIASAVACIMMGLVAKYPFALAPGMGLNAYFVFGIVIGLGVSYQVALTAVFVEGLLFIALSIGGLRSAVLHAIPAPLRIATMSGIGLFLALIGLENAGIVVADQATLITLGDIRSDTVLLALATLILISVLTYRRIPGAILIGIVLATGTAWIAGIATPPQDWFVAPALPGETFLAFDFSGLMNGAVIGAVLALLFVDFFDTAGTLLGVGMLGGYIDKDGKLPRSRQAFTADAVGTAVGAMLGTSTVTSYIESSAGIEEGGRTGLTAVVVGVLFLLSLVFIPVFTAVPAAATAPVLMFVGAMMLQKLDQIDWKNTTESIPAFLTITLMPLSFSIANGIAAGILSYTVIRLLSGEARSVSAIMYVLSLLLIGYYLFLG
jgi:adenine/guanine/hypoxanthine permease